jgi:large conductance mechanosensitive channel
MKKSTFFSDFKDFIMRGNVMDMAVGVIIGAAFKDIVTSLTDSFITPLIQAITGGDSVEIGGQFVINGAAFTYGAFLSSVVNFLIMALILFTMIRAVNKVMSLGKKPEEPAAPTEKECPYCMTKISIKATRCPHCTSELKITE